MTFRIGSLEVSRALKERICEIITGDALTEPQGVQHFDNSYGNTYLPLPVIISNLSSNPVQVSSSATSRITAVGSSQTRVAPFILTKSTTAEATVRTTTTGKTAYYYAILVSNGVGTSNDVTFREATAGSESIQFKLAGSENVLLHNNGLPLLVVASAANLTLTLGSATAVTISVLEAVEE